MQQQPSGLQYYVRYFKKILCGLIPRRPWLTLEINSMVSKEISGCPLLVVLKPCYVVIPMNQSFASFDSHTYQFSIFIGPQTSPPLPFSPSFHFRRDEAALEEALNTTSFTSAYQSKQTMNSCRPVQDIYIMLSRNYIWSVDKPSFCRQWMMWPGISLS
jgi:hypothetical protein